MAGPHPVKQRRNNSDKMPTSTRGAGRTGDGHHERKTKRARLWSWWVLRRGLRMARRHAWRQSNRHITPYQPVEWLLDDWS